MTSETEIDEPMSKSLEESSTEKKKQKLQDLYKKITEIEAYIKCAKYQIQEIVLKNANSNQKLDN